MMDEAEDRYTSGHYLEMNPTWHEEFGPWKAAHVRTILERNNLVPTSVCEIGTGSGEVLRLLAEGLPGARFVGYDIAEQAISLAAPKAMDRLRFEQGSPFGESDVFDVVLALDVLEHVPDYLGFISQVRTTGRYQIYNIPLDLSARSVLQRSGIMNQRARVGHLHYFFKDTALATLRDTGHEVIDWFYTSQAFDWGPSPFRWPIVVLRRALFRIAPDITARLMGGFSMTVLCR